MRRFATEVTVFVLVQVLLLGWFIWQFNGEGAELSIYAATRVKHDRLDAAPSPRAIVVGGSSLLYGIDSPRLGEATGYNVVNMGLIGGLRLEFMLREVEHSTRPGDLVILGLEYPQFTQAASAAGTQVLMRVLLNRPSSIRFLSWEHWRLLGDGGVLEELGIAFRQAFKNVTSGSREESERPINEYGDLVQFHHVDKEPNGATQRAIPRRLRWEIIEANIERVNEFARTVRASGADVVYVYPPFSRTYWESDRDRAVAFHEALLERLDVPIIATQRAMIQPSPNFINDSYHLWGAGVRAHTDRIARAVQRWKEVGTEAWEQPAFDVIMPPRLRRPKATPGDAEGAVDEEAANDAAGTEHVDGP